MSLRTRIVALGAGAAAAVIILLVPAVVLTSQRSARTELQQDATAVAQGVADYASAGATSSTQLAPYVDRVNGRRNKTPVTVTLPDGQTLGAARPECTTSLASMPRSDDGRPDGGGGGRGGDHGDDDGGGLLPTSTATVHDVDGGQVAAITTAGDGGDIVICAFIADGDVTEAVVEQAGGFAAAAVVILLVVVAVALWIARRLASDLSVAAATADRLSDGDLTARVPRSGPDEVQRVGTALNRLADRIDDLLRMERETVADLSHRLRTPMTTVRLDVEALPSSEAKDELSDHLGHLERTLTAVIQAARRGEREGAVPHCDAVSVVRDRYRYWAPLLEDQARAARLEIEDGTTGQARCASEDLASAVDALLENAVAHTADGTAVRVVVRSTPDGWTEVDVADQGSGVPDHALRRGRSDRGSSGLGLDIARSCAESTGGSLSLEREGTWAIVRLTLGPALI